MALKRRGKKGIYSVELQRQGKRIRQSTGTTNYQKAKRLHDEIAEKLWNIQYRPHSKRYIWQDAVIRWIKEAEHNNLKMLYGAKIKLRWLSQHLDNKFLDEIDRDLIDKISYLKLDEKVTKTTVNRYLELIRSILRKAAREWLWIEKAPIIKLYRVNNARIRYLKKEEAIKLLEILPSHLSDMAAFTLSTGLRHANVVGLKWEYINLCTRHLSIPAAVSKTNNPIAVPLNDDAIYILRKWLGKHPEYVFVFRGNPIKCASNETWRKYLKKLGLDNFRWHDLRHTWASWHIQSGTSLEALQAMGGWSNFNMVLRYAHLSSANLLEAAQRISDAKMPQPVLRVIKNV